MTHAYIYIYMHTYMQTHMNLFLHTLISEGEMELKEADNLTRFKKGIGKWQKYDRELN